METSSAPAAAEQVVEDLTETMQTLSHTDFVTLWSSFKQTLIDLLPSLTTAVIIFVIGYLLIHFIVKFTHRILTHSKADPALHHFVLSALRISLYIFLAIIITSLLIPRAIGGMVATLSIFGLAISLAVKDSLANLSGGISLLFTKPFSQGDFVTIDSLEGTVQDIRLNYTVLSTIDNKRIHIPNGDVAKAKITNFTSQPNRRLDLNFPIGYRNDFEEGKRIINSLLEQHQMALHDPEPIVRVMELGDSAVVIGCRVWVSTADYWSLKYDLLEQVKTAFDVAGISIPYSQLDVHVKNLP